MLEKKPIKYMIVFLLLAICLFTWAEDEREEKAAGSGIPTYVGMQKCRGCHRGERREHISDKWEVSKHARAFDALNEMEKKNPICLQCHTTGYGKMPNDEYLEGVQCEACHGPGSEYKSGKIMNERRFEVQHDKQHKLALEAGLVVPTMKTCRRCHRTNLADYQKTLPEERPE